MAGVFRSNAPTKIVSITPSNDDDLADAVSAIMVAGAGDVNIKTPDGSETVITVSANVVYDVNCVRILADDTDATGIVGFVYGA